MKSHSKSFDVSNPLSYLWDLATEALADSITKYPQLSALDGLHVVTDWAHDQENNVHPYRLVVVGEEDVDNTWSRHETIYEMGLLTGLNLYFEGIEEEEIERKL